MSVDQARVDGVTAGAVQTTEAGHRRRTWRGWVLLRRNLAAQISLVVLAVVVLSAIFAPWLAPQDPLDQATARRFRPPAWEERSLPGYVLGTDQQGRDVLSRIIYGSRISVIVGITAVVISVLIGVTLGLLAGYYPGVVGDIIGRLADIQLAFPTILLALVLVAVVGPSLLNVILILGVVGWVVYARVVRGRVLTIERMEFVQAARALGATDRRIIVRHILPNVLTPVIVLATLELATVIIAEASLSFLGVGVQPPTPTWGNMLADGREYVQRAWWLSTFPGLAILLTVLSVNLLGDWLRDTLDPRFRAD